MNKKFEIPISAFCIRPLTFVFRACLLQLLVIIPLAVSAISCTQKQVIVDKKLLASDEKKSRALLERILKINEQSPAFYSARLSMEGVINKKRITSIGDAAYRKDPRQIRFNFLDAVFKSPITTIIQNGETVKVYFPVDKTLYIDNIKTMKLKNYTPFDFDFTLLQAIAGGQIPLLEDYRVKKELSEAGQLETAGDTCFLILENEEYYQTISFSNNIPDKLLLLKKSSREKIEIYLEKPLVKNDGVFYKT
ncbi:MAG TPA: hypothetical protein ENN21_04205, partial [Spirochaetes bacterium]|nr:hypothetical protein [Spirochaetota bacterium]